MTDIKKIKTHVPRLELSVKNRKSSFKIVARELIYPPIYWFMAHLYKVPGLHIQAIIYLLGLKLLAQGKFRLVYSQKLLSSPMDSVRYFEFDFFYKRFPHDSDVENYLDVSSPRLFLALIMRHHTHMKATIINPDIRDLNITKELFSACGFQNRCKFFNDTIANLSLPDRSFDIITSISVIEHIPGEGDIEALKKMWCMLKPNGKLFISVPCAHTAFEEFIDYNQYGLLQPDEDSYVYGQRFYDKKLLEDRFWNITGTPVNVAIYGEKHEGYFMNNRKEQHVSDNYPFWREPYVTGLNYMKYDRIEDLPGIGIITLEFIK